VNVPLRARFGRTSDGVRAITRRIEEQIARIERGGGCGRPSTGDVQAGCGQAAARALVL